jgi:putative acetyltransferase
MAPTVDVRLAREADLDALTDLWEASARGSHTFMKSDDFDQLRPYMRDALLPSMDVWIAELEHEPVGFIGVREQHVELLYIERDHQHCGIGTLLLEHVHATSVEVYRDNAVGVSFYRRSGFAQTAVHEYDAIGRPYPMVELTR